MEKMKSDALLDYAVFQLSPKRSRCELFVSSGGSIEKLASGFLKPFVAHLKAAEEQVTSAAQSIKLELERRKNAEAWFSKGTLDRFVRFVSTPEVLESVNTFDAEMSQLESARRIYSQGAGEQLPGGSGSGLTAADDVTKKELLRAIDVRLIAVQRDLTSACAHAAAAGFNVDTVSKLQKFADRFGAHRLNEACGKFISLCERRTNLINQCKSGFEDEAVRSSCGSDMSIDDPPPSPPPRLDSAMYHQGNTPSIIFTLSRESSVERDAENKPDNANALGENDRKDETSTPDRTGSMQAASLPLRRLSVQDRINLFENKQKENSGGKPVVVKSVELRRLSSDVSTMGVAAEKAVLRRWSGVSDMSIDLSAGKDTESPLCTPSTETFLQENKVLNSNDDTAKSSSVVKPELKVFPSLNRTSESRLEEGSDKSEHFSKSSKLNSNLIPLEIDGLKDQWLGTTQSRSFTGKADNQENLEEKSKNLFGCKSQTAPLFVDQRKLKDSLSGKDISETQSQIAGFKDQDSSLTQNRHIGSKGRGQVDTPNPKEDSDTRDKSVAQTSLKSTCKTVGESGVFEGNSGLRIRDAFTARYKEVEGDLSSAQHVSRSARETAVVEKKELYVTKNGSLSGVEDSGPRRMKFNRHGPAAELSKKAKVQQDGNSRMLFSGRVKTDTQDGFDSFATPPPEQFQRVRQSKGNQDLNDELKMKANELEKLFSEHKLRLPGDLSNSTRKGKLEDAECEPVSSLNCSNSIRDISPQLSDNFKSNEPTGNLKNKTKCNSASSMKTVDSQNYVDALNRSFSELSVSEGSRGKLYHRYTEKRDAKLKEDWISNRAKKEAKLKTMQDSLERNRSEMKAKFFGSTDRQHPVSSARWRSDRLRSYNSRSILNRGQQHLDFWDSDVDGEALGSLEKNCPGEDRSADDVDSRNGISNGAQGKKHLINNRNLSSATPRTSASAVPRSATKTSTNSMKRRMQPENPLAQSVPNFSDLRKENNKPSSAGIKPTSSQVRNYARSKSSNEEVAIVKEDKSRRLHALRKSSANPSEFVEMSTLDSDGVGLTALKFDEEIFRSAGTKPFLKKGSVGFVAQTSIVRQRISVGSEPTNNVNVDEIDDAASEPDEYESTVKDEREKKFRTLDTEGHDFSEYGEPVIRLDAEKFVNSGSENDDSSLTFSQVDQALGSQLPSEIPSSFLLVDSLQGSPSESPVSWNLHTRYPFLYPQETFDIDASVDSPVGSPSWNSPSLNQMEADAAPMRKKWGTAQKPILGASSSHSLSRKDMSRGFKRLLNFGRKNRGSETLVDWISATTSEGDNDMEDGQDPANRSSEDLRKSRMGFSQALPSDDSFNESEFFNESAPRSFFSLSSLRSKGSESKTR